MRRFLLTTVMLFDNTSFSECIETGADSRLTAEEIYKKIDSVPDDKFIRIGETVARKKDIKIINVTEFNGNEPFTERT